MSCDEDSEGRLNRTKLSEGLPSRKLGAIELLSSEGFPLQNCRCRTAVLSVASSDNEQGRFDSTRFYEVSFQEIWGYRTVKFTEHEGSEGGSIAPNFLKGNASEKVLLSELLRLPDLKTAVR